jgi:hypothetical protein
MNCEAFADRQPDGSYLARGQIKSFDVSITIGGVKAPNAKRVGDLVAAEFSKPVPLAYETKQNVSKCEKCATPIFWHSGQWLDAFSERFGDAVCHAMPTHHQPLDLSEDARETTCMACGLTIHRYAGGLWYVRHGDGSAADPIRTDAKCRATPEQKAHPLMLKDVVENPKLLAPKPCDHRAGVVMSNGEARCAGCHLLVGTAIKNQERLYDQFGEMLRHAGQYPEKVLAELLSADPLTTALSKQVARRLLTPRDPFPLPPPEYGVDMSPFIKTPGFGEAVRHAIEMIKPATLSLDEMMLSAGYVPKADVVKLAHQLSEGALRLVQERGDELQTVNDEMRAIKAENSDLRRKVERLERRK